MPTLYHGEPSAETLKLTICLREKGLDFAAHFVDEASLARWSDTHRKLAPQGQLPVLIDGDLAMTEAAFALQYLAEAYSPRLAPTAPADWYNTQAWIATLDMALGPAVNLLGWMKLTSRETRDDYRRRLAAVPGRQAPAGWAAVWADAEANEDQLANARERIGQAVGRIERRLAEADWLAGTDYSIADIAAFGHCHSLPRLLPAIVNTDATPRTLDWISRIAARPAVVAAMALRRAPGSADCYSPPR